MTEMQVYASYAWKVEEQTQILDKLTTVCQSHNIRILRDKDEIGYRESIQAYMSQLVASDAIILVLSDAYFKSPYCMYELCEIYKRKDFLKRVYPIVIDGTRFHKANERIPYIRHWEQEVAELNDGLKSIRTGNMSAASLAEIKEYEDFARMIDNLLAALGDMNTLTQDVHIGSKFELIVTQLLSNDINCKIYLRQKNFEAKICTELRDILNKKSMRSLRRIFFNNLSDSSEGLITDEIEKWWQQHDSLQRVKFFRESADYFLKDFINQEDFLPKSTYLQIRQIMGWILLANISQEWLSTDYISKNPFWDIPLEYVAGVEILVARSAEIPAILYRSKQGFNVFGEGQIAIEQPTLKIPESGWVPDYIIEQTGLIAWKVAFKDSKRKMSDVDWKILSGVLSGKKKYLTVNAGQDNKSPLLDNNICELLSKKLKGVNIIRFGVVINGYPSPLIVNEGELLSEIFLFLESMENYENS